MSEQKTTFDDLNLDKSIMKALSHLGYEMPSPVQAAAIPVMMNGEDIRVLAQTGTGKTAAFALPVIGRLNDKGKKPQVLVLTPTRELAIQVSEAFAAYARFIKNFHVLPIYGGQDYSLQIRQLRRGPQVVVGTPGRTLDHLRKGTLNLSEVTTMILDEADEMLRMGFIDDVETIMAETAADRQTALFSATMPERIKRIAEKYMKSPRDISIVAKATTVENIDQYYWYARGARKLEALTRILETETYEGVIVFARTKHATSELAEKLEARGYAAAALNGDMTQNLRLRTVSRLKSGKLDILVATDVAARGLDVERVSLVINFDIPHDNESYIHRVGRTGRAGRCGKAILFVLPREKHLLKSIERTIGQPIQEMALPSPQQASAKRIEIFRDALASVLAEKPLGFYRDLTAQLCEELEVSERELAAGLLYLAQKDRPLNAASSTASGESKGREDRARSVTQERGSKREERGSEWRERDFTEPPKREKPKPRDIPRFEDEGVQDHVEGPDGDLGMEVFRIEVGSEHGVEVRHIVGTIANEAGLDSEFIGAVSIYDDHTTVELPGGMPKPLLRHFRDLEISKRPMRLKRVKGSPPSKAKREKASGKPSRGDRSTADGGSRKSVTAKKVKKTGKPSRASRSAK